MTEAHFYTGSVTHHRLSGPTHRLRYRLAYVLIDLDEMNGPRRGSRLLGLGRSGLMCVLAKDHGQGGATDLARWAREFLKAQGVEADCARIELLTLPRMFGYVFNPISVYLFYDRRGALHHILYEVNNTFGGRKFYLAKAQAKGERYTHECRKTFYVSPFFDVDGGYRFWLRPPCETVGLAIDYLGREGDVALKARLAAKRRPATQLQSLKTLVAFPFMTLGVIAAIYWEALLLFMKGAKFRPAPTYQAEAGDNPARLVALDKRKKALRQEAIHGRI